MTSLAVVWHAKYNRPSAPTREVAILVRTGKAVTDAEFLNLTASLMREHSVRLRDTYLESSNLDDFFANGRRYNGPRRFKIEWLDFDGFAHSKGTMYEVAGFASVAYDAQTIVMPMRFKDSDRDDAVVHECVHFLQHTTVEEDQRYISFTGNNYHAYVSQRVELEAHLIQIAHIFAAHPGRVEASLSEDDRSIVTKALACAKAGRLGDVTLSAILICKERNLI